MASQFNPPPGVGGAPRQPRLGGGLYGPFGMPDKLVAIHFPDAATNTTQPWFWYLDRQQPQEFSFLAVPTGGDGPVKGGDGWIRLPDFSIIRILQADTQLLHRIPLLGSLSLEDAVENHSDEADTSWGRFDFRDQRFWATIGGYVKNPLSPNDGNVLGVPAFNQNNGVITAQTKTTKNIAGTISTAANKFATDWNLTSATYNALATKVDPVKGFKYPGQTSAFAIPLPSGPPATLSTFSAQLNAFAAGPPYSTSLLGTVQPSFTAGIPPTAFFNINTLTTGAYAVTLKVGQLDPKHWDMSVFPPRFVPNIFSRQGSFYTGNYSGFGNTSFPLSVSFS